MKLLAAIGESPPINPPQSQITISFEQIVVLSAGSFCLLTMGLVRWFVLRSIRDYESTIKFTKEEISSIKKEIAALQKISDAKLGEIDRRFIELNTKFVDREDYLKHQTTTDLKLDSLHKRLDEMMVIMLKSAK